MFIKKELTSLVLLTITLTSCTASTMESGDPHSEGGFGRQVTHMPQHKETRAIHKPDGPTRAQTTELYYYDGVHKRALFACADLLAEFNPSAEQRTNLLATGAIECELSSRQRAVRLWKVSGVEPNELARSGNEAVGRPVFSPMFRDASGSSAPTRALPGGVIVTLHEGWSETRASSWLASRQLVALRRLPIGGHVFVIESPAGLPSLELANRLFESGEVRAATPNWWQDATPR